MRGLRRRALDFSTIFGHDLERGDAYTAPKVSVEQARRNPFVYACQSLISGTLAVLPWEVVHKSGDIRTIMPDPDWLVAPNPLNPNYTDSSYKRQLALSLLQDGNAFVAVYPDVFEPTQLLVLNPQQVEIVDGDSSPVYRVTNARGGLLAELTAMNCLHMPFFLPPGYTRGLSPIEAHALTIGIDLASQKQASKFLSGGGVVTGVIEVPREAGKLTEPQLDQLRESFKRKREGPSGYSIGVLDQGAKFHEIQPTLAESEYINNRKLSREEVAGIYLVPPFFIGSEEPAAQAYASTEARAQHLIDYCLIHYSDPLEKGHRRLLPAAEKVETNYNALLKGNIKERYEGYATGLQNRFLYLEDVWRYENLNPDRPGTPLETPNNSGIVTPSSSTKTITTDSGRSLTITEGAA